jgi:hypothetical protein
MPKDLGVHGGAVAGTTRPKFSVILKRSLELPFVQVGFAWLAAALAALENVVERFGPLERTSRIRT